MHIKTLVRRTYQAISPYGGVTSIEDTLAEESFLVVKEEGEFVGLLVPADVVKCSHRLVADCLREKPRLDCEQEIKTALELMRESRNSALPVFEEGQFVGVIVRGDLADYLFEYHQEIERQVAERTRELEATNERLQRALVRRREAEQALQQRNSELTLLNSAQKAFTTMLDLNEVLDIVLEETRGLLGVVACSIWLTDPDTGELVCRQASGPKSNVVRGWRLSPGEGFAGWVAQRGESLVVPDARADERHFQAVDRETGLNLHSILTVPLQVRDGVVGVLQAVDTERGRFGEADLKLLEPLAGSAAVAIENARLYEKARREIQERARAEEALHQSEQKFRSIVEQSTDGFVLMDREGIIVQWNQAMERITGLLRDEVLGQPIWDAQYCLALDQEREAPGAYDQARDRVLDIREDERPPWLNRLVECEIQRPDGRRRFVQFIVFLIKMDNRLMLGSVMRDVTEHRRAEEALRESEERLRMLIESTEDIVCMHDFEGRYLYYHGPSRYGVDSEDMVGRTPFDLFPPEQAGPIVEQIRETYSSGERKTVENQVDWEGGALWFSDQIVPVLDDEGTVTAVAKFCRNITERKRVEDKIRRRSEELAAINAIAATVSQTLNLNQILNDALREVLSLNFVSPEGGGLIFLLDEQEGMLSPAAHRGIPDDHLCVDRPIRLGECLCGKAALRGEIVISDGDPEEERHSRRWPGMEKYKAICLPLKARRRVGGVMFVRVVSGQEITQEQICLLEAVSDQISVAVENARLFEEVRAGREQLRELSQRLVEAQETERRRIARELHDVIGQALTVAKLNLQAARGAPDVPTLQRHLDEGIATMERTLGQVRDLSFQLRPSLLDDLGLVPALRWYVDRQARHAGWIARFTSDIPEERLSPELEITCFRIVQEALTNVVRHARARQVDVALWQCAKELHLTIRDDGVGFDVQRALEHPGRGRSLGLRGMEERVQLVGGQIDIESQPGQGAEIHARFPLALFQPLESQG